MKRPSDAEIESLSHMLAERLDVATAEILQLIHRETGKRFRPAAIDTLRNRIAWCVSMSYVDVLCNQEAQRKKKP